MTDERHATAPGGTRDLFDDTRGDVTRSQRREDLDWRSIRQSPGKEFRRLARSNKGTGPHLVHGTLQRREPRGCRAEPGASAFSQRPEIVVWPVRSALGGNRVPYEVHHTPPRGRATLPVRLDPAFCL